MHATQAHGLRPAGLSYFSFIVLEVLSHSALVKLSWVEGLDHGTWHCTQYRAQSWTPVTAYCTNSTLSCTRKRSHIGKAFRFAVVKNRRRIDDWDAPEEGVSWARRILRRVDWHCVVWSVVMESDLLRWRGRRGDGVVLIEECKMYLLVSVPWFVPS